MGKKDCNSLKIHDISPDTMHSLLRWIYTGRVNLTRENLNRFKAAGEKLKIAGIWKAPAEVPVPDASDAARPSPAVTLNVAQSPFTTSEPPRVVDKEVEAGKFLSLPLWLFL